MEKHGRLQPATSTPGLPAPMISHWPGKPTVIRHFGTPPTTCPSSKKASTRCLEYPPQRLEISAA
jgi:hypothetical protein